MQTVNVVVPVKINAAVDDVFLLPCPVREFDWIIDWKCVITHCPGNAVGLGTQFVEKSSSPWLTGRPLTKITWTAIHYDKNNHEIDYLITGGNIDCLYKMRFQNDGNAGTVGTLDFTYKNTGKAPKNIKRKIRLMIEMLNVMLTHYCETGAMIDIKRLRAGVRPKFNLPVLTARDKMILIINKIFR